MQQLFVNPVQYVFMCSKQTCAQLYSVFVLEQANSLVTILDKTRQDTGPPCPALPSSVGQVKLQHQKFGRILCMPNQCSTWYCAKLGI